MKINLGLSRKRWLALTMAAVLVASAVTAGILFAADGAKQPGRNVSLKPVPESVSAQTPDAQEQINLPPVEREPPAYPNLDSNLNRLAEGSQAVRRQASENGGTLGQSDEPVLVTFYIEPEHVGALRRYLEDNGVYVRNAGEDYIEAHVPPSLLGDASEQPGVLRVDTVIPPRRSQSRKNAVSQGVGLHGADAWHSAGYRGSGVRVGVIDDGFEGFSRLQGSELPAEVTARCYFAGPRPPSSHVSDCEVNGDHGTAVAETLIDVAPDAALYIANPYSPGDLRNAVDWMAQQGVRVINVSLGYPPDGPGDGTSPDSDSPLRTIDASVAQGVMWTVAGGNLGQGVWYGTFWDLDNDGWHDFGPRDEGNTFTVEEGDLVTAFMRWDDDWGGADCDLDLALFKTLPGSNQLEPVGADDRVQDGSAGSDPLAGLYSIEPATAQQAGQYALAIRKNTCEDDPEWIQLIAWIDDDLQYFSPSHQMGNPAESRSAGMLAVGASHYWDTQSIARYSSRGPALDGRTKPDITGVACGRSTVVSPVTLGDGTQCWFAGTSASAPHVAGLAALALQRFPNFRPAQVTRYLELAAAERGAAGDDNIWGYGLATLPDPSTAPVTEPVLAVAPPATNIAVRDGPNAGEVIVSWDAVPEATYYRVGYVNMKSDYPQAKASVTGEWRAAFLYSDVNALNFAVINGRVEYTVKRLERGAYHAFTVHTTSDASYAGLINSGQFRWPDAPDYWQYHTVR